MRGYIITDISVHVDIYSKQSNKRSQQNNNICSKYNNETHHFQYIYTCIINTKSRRIDGQVVIE